MKPELLAFSSEIRSLPVDGKVPHITGKPVVYNVLSLDLGGFQERVLPGAFTKTLQEGNPKSLWNHDANYVLGSRKGGNLSIADSQYGLDFDVLPPETQWVRDIVIPAIDRGDVDQMSFGFRVIADRWIFETDIIIRELLEVQLLEVSPVAFPAYPQTSVGLRQALGSDADLLPELREKATKKVLTEHDRTRMRDLVAALNGQTGPAPLDHPDNQEGGSEEPDLSRFDRALLERA